MDRAKKRRELYPVEQEEQDDSDNEKAAPEIEPAAAVYPTPFSGSNLYTPPIEAPPKIKKGKDLLKKFGWNEGEVLGKNPTQEEDSEAQNPIKVYFREEQRAGIGYANTENQKIVILFHYYSFY